MTRSTTILCSLLLAMLWLGQALASVPSQEDFWIIVHPQNPVSVVERDFLRDAFLKKATNWPHGTAIRPIDFGGKAATRERFIIDILRKTPSQLRSYWTQRIFSGIDVPPPEADTAASVIQFVLKNPGAVSYLPAGVDPAGAKVIKLSR